MQVLPINAEQFECIEGLADMSEYCISHPLLKAAQFAGLHNSKAGVGSAHLYWISSPSAAGEAAVAEINGKEEVTILSCSKAE